MPAVINKVHIKICKSKYSYLCFTAEDVVQVLAQLWWLELISKASRTRVSIV